MSSRENSAFIKSYIHLHCFHFLFVAQFKLNLLLYGIRVWCMHKKAIYAIPTNFCQKNENSVKCIENKNSVFFFLLEWKVVFSFEFDKKKIQLKYNCR